MPGNRKCVERQDQWRKECQETGSAWKDKTSGGRNARKQEVRGKTRPVEEGMPGNRKREQFNGITYNNQHRGKYSCSKSLPRIKARIGIVRSAGNNRRRDNVSMV